MANCCRTPELVSLAMKLQQRLRNADAKAAELQEQRDTWKNRSSQLLDALQSVSTSCRLLAPLPEAPSSDHLAAIVGAVQACAEHAERERALRISLHCRCCAVSRAYRQQHPRSVMLVTLTYGVCGVAH